MLWETHPVTNPIKQAAILLFKLIAIAVEVTVVEVGACEETITTIITITLRFETTLNYWFEVSQIIIFYSIQSIMTYFFNTLEF